MQSVIVKSRKPDLTFHITGRINISARIARELQLKSGDLIDIMEDDDQHEAYIYVRHRAPNVGRHEGMVFPSHKGSYHFIASSKALCEYILRKCEQQKKAAVACGLSVQLKYYGKAFPIIIPKQISIQ